MKRVIYAGLDVDGIAKLFTLDENGMPRKIEHAEWLEILASLPLVETGEMPVVTLEKEALR